MPLNGSQLQLPDYIVLVGYFALILGVGAYFYRHMKGMKDYFSGGNNIPWWLSGVSFYMSSFSVFAFVGYSAIAYKYGWVAVTLFWASVPATMASVLLFSKKWRRARIDSPVEYLEARYDPLVRQLFAWEGLPVRIIDDALKLVAIATILHAGLGVEMVMCLLGSGLIMLAYTLMGGLWAVAVTDFIQFVVMLVAILVMLPLAISKAGGIGTAFGGVEGGFFQLTHPPEYDTVYVLYFVLLITLAYSSINWSLIQRYYCVPKEKDAIKVGWLVTLLFVIGPPLILLPAMVAPKFLAVPPDQDEMVYALLCLKLLPVGMMGLVIAAMFAATMSMLSSDYNVCAAVLTNDVYRRCVRPRASEKELVLVGRLMTLLIGVITLRVALFMMIHITTGEELFRGMAKLFSIFTAPVAIPMIAGLLWRKMNKNGALAGFLAGVTVGLILFYRLDDQTELLGTILKKEVILLFSTMFVTSVVMVCVSLALPAGPSERQRAEAFLHRLSVPIGQLDEDKAPAGERGTGAISPFRVVGISVMLIGVLMLAILPWTTDGLAFGLDLGIASALLLIGGLTTWQGSRGKNVEPSVKTIGDGYE
jgi:SSS family transporter